MQTQPLTVQKRMGMDVSQQPCLQRQPAAGARPRPELADPPQQGAPAEQPAPFLAPLALCEFESTLEVRQTQNELNKLVTNFYQVERSVAYIFVL